MNHPDRQILMLHETYAAGVDSCAPCSHSAQEAGVVVRGAIEVTVGDESRILMEGDGYCFDSKIPLRFRNVSGGTSIILSAATPPTH